MNPTTTAILVTAGTTAGFLIGMFAERARRRHLDHQTDRQIINRILAQPVKRSLRLIRGGQ